MAPARVTYEAVDGPRSLTVDIEEGDYGDPSQWYDQYSGRGPLRHWAREYNHLRASMTSHVEPRDDDPIDWFDDAAEGCLALAGIPPPDLDAEDGTVLRAPGLHLIARGDHAVLVSEYFDAELWAPAAGPVEIKPVTFLPEDLIRGWLDDLPLRIVACGNDDWMLVFGGQGWAFDPDGKNPPEAIYWRRTLAGWSKETRIRGFVAGCGPDWTLVAEGQQDQVQGPEPADGHPNTMPAVSIVRWSLGLRGATTMPAPTLEPSQRYACPHRLDLMGIAALPSGEVFAVGTECVVGRKHRAAAAQRWRLGERRGRFEYLPVAAGSWYQAVAAFSPRDVEATFELESGSVDVHFDGQHWSRGPPAVEGGFDIEKDSPDGRVVGANFSKSKDPRAALARIEESFVSPSGDGWAVVRFNKNYCGRCFNYRALVRIRADRFVPVERPGAQGKRHTEP